VATLLSKVRDVTKSETTETSDISVVNFLNAGSVYAISSIPRKLLHFLGTDGSAITDGNGQAVSNIDEVLEVRRKNITCDEVPASLSNQLDTSGSLYAPTAYFPVYFVRGGLIFIKPTPTAVYPGLITTVTPPVITSTTDDAAISYKHIENIILNYARALDFAALSSYFSTLNTDKLVNKGTADRALQSARAFMGDTAQFIHVDAGAMGDTLTKSVADQLTAEDSELSQITTQAAAQEVQRAMAEIAMGRSFSEAVNIYVQKSDQYFKQAEADVRNFINSNSQIMAIKQAQGEANVNNRS